MDKTIKMLSGCVLAAICFVACDGADIGQVESIEERQPAPVVERTESYDAIAEVVFHEYVPEEQRAYTYGSYSFVNTTWKPVTIIECCGMRKRFEDQGTYEMYFLNEKLRATVSDGIDGAGNVVSCDFSIGARF